MCLTVLSPSLSMFDLCITVETCLPIATGFGKSVVYEISARNTSKE